MFIGIAVVVAIGLIVRHRSNGFVLRHYRFCHPIGSHLNAFYRTFIL